jgi:hypothetical protein
MRQPSTGITAPSTGPSSGAWVGGDGPCNRERLADRVKAWEDGEWVREAALAHARKSELKEAA